MLRLAVRGAWASARFGASLAEPYLKTLETGPLLRAFDGVLGLVSIALLSPQECRPIHRAIAKALKRRRRARIDDSIVMDALLRSRQTALSRDLTRRRGAPPYGVTRGPEMPSRWAPGRRSTPSMMMSMPPRFDQDGFCPAILAMGTFASAPAGALFRDHTGAIESNQERALNALKRTLGPRDTPATSPVWNLKTQHTAELRLRTTLPPQSRSLSGNAIEHTHQRIPCIDPGLPRAGWRSQAIAHDGDGVEVGGARA